MAEARAVPSLAIGGCDEEFVNAVEEDLLCSICRLPLKEAVQTGKCGHRFCRQCLDEHFRRLKLNGQAIQCPIDRYTLIPDKDIFADKATERKIISFIIKCPSEGCQWTGELRSKEVHQSECRRFPLNCPQNCGAVIPREEISSHIEKDCPLTIISCPYAHMGCTTKVQRKEVESHLQATVRLHLDLAGVKLHNMQVQLSNTQVQLSDTLVQLNDTQEELKDTTRKHEEKFKENTQKIVEKFKESTIKLEEKFKESTIKLEEKVTMKLEEKFKESIIKLEEKVNESTIELEEKVKESTIKTELKIKESTIKLEEKVKESTIKLEEKVNVLTKTMQCLDEHNHQDYMWKIKGFREVLRKAKSGEKNRIDSSSFCIYGYKCKLRLDPNGHGSGKNIHLSVFLIIMKSKYDATLPWPFHKKVTFTLIDQQENPNDRENIVKSITTVDPKWKECFARPVTDENNGYGFAEFVSHDKLRERRYIVDDTMFIQVQVEPPE